MVAGLLCEVTWGMTWRAGAWAMLAATVVMMATRRTLVRSVLSRRVFHLLVCLSLSLVAAVVGCPGVVVRQVP